SIHPRNPILLNTHLADPLSSSIPSANGAGIKGGRPLGNLCPLPKKMLHRQIPNFQLHGSQFQTLADEV
uniref:Uncharacterized protein n=1 Tax=Cucumis melo TaxID=3656 RepID=A0A9I9E2I5_CUCME